MIITCVILRLDDYAFVAHMGPMSDRTKPAIAINVNSVKCPRCSTRQPKFRMPRSLRQFLFGGWTCERCDTEMDSFGRPVFRH